MSEEPPADPGLARSVPEALDLWRRTVFGAPRRFADLVVGPPEVRDEVIHRVVTEVVRRDIKIVSTATRETRSTPPRLNPGDVDPFAHTEATLRAASEHVTHCDACRASGSESCGDCRGRATVECDGCGGSGQVRKYSKKSSRLVNCKVCKASGRVRCGECAGKGTVTCRACNGSGHVLAWLTISESEETRVVIAPQSQILHAHPILRQPCQLEVGELDAFAIENHVGIRGTLDPRALPEGDRGIVIEQLEGVDRRLERVRSQQLLRLAVVRRDVTYEMCGARGTVVLSGRHLVASPTPESRRPIRRRLFLWPIPVVLVGIAAFVLRDLFVGKTIYFKDAKGGTAFLGLLATMLAIPVFGALLRSWRGGLRFHRVRAPIVITSLAIPLSLAGIAVYGLLARPAIAEVDAAIHEGDLERARQVVEALRDQSGSTASILDAQDRITLAEAATRTGSVRLQMLDGVAARRGAAADEATTAARAERLTQVRALLASKKTAEALDALDRWFPAKTEKDPAIAEERARAHDLAREACATDSCRLAESLAAKSARLTDARVSTAAGDRDAVMAAIDPKRVDVKELLGRVRQLRQLVGVASQAATDLAAVPDVAAEATKSRDWATAELAKVPLLRNPAPVIEEVVGAKLAPVSKNLAGVELSGVAAYFALDGNSKSSGVYVVGAGHDRTLASADWPPERLLSQTVGKPATLHKPAPNAPSTTRWFEAGYPVVARWRDGTLVELRIGDATP